MLRSYKTSIYIDKHEITNYHMCIFTKNKSINALQQLKHAREIMMINKKLAFKLTMLPLILGSASHAAMAYGADGVIIESHCQPKRGIGDDPKQAITPEVLSKLIKDINQIWAIRKDYNKELIPAKS
jgi:3-deoxy-D-arabino-heptulosonate 7-phosphate (DAHP) synthase